MSNNTFYNISPWSIFNEMLYADRPFNSMFRTLAHLAEGRFPPVNSYVGDTAIVLDFEMPGRTPADIDINIEPQAVTIEDTSKDAAGKTGQRGKRRIELPFSIDTENTKATFKNGILRIEMPKSKSEAPRKITIGTAD